MSTISVTLEIPSEILVSLGDTGLKNAVPIGDYSNEVLRFALLNGFIKAVNDVSRGEDENGKVLDDKAWQEKRAKRMTAWADGQWALRGAGERGDSNLRFLKEHYYFECLTERGLAASKVDKEIKETVAAHLPKDTKATFDNFLLAVATANGGTKDEIEATYKAIEASLQERADAAKVAREKSAKKLDVTGILLAKK